MQSPGSDPIILLGSGLSGSLMAVYLAQRGFQVKLFERRPDMRRTDISAGKSINLAISVRGLSALAGVGLKSEIEKICIPMRGRVMHATDGALTYQPYSKDGVTAINSISRGDLNMKLMDLAETFPNIEIIFHQRSIGVDVKTGEVQMRDEQTGKEYSVSGQAVIACDGAFSGIRESLLRTPRFNYSQNFLGHGYKELTIPATAEGGWRMEKNALHIWPRGQYMLIALPNMDGSYTVTLFFPFEGKNSFATLQDQASVEQFFREEFPDAMALMPDLAADFFENPTGDLVTIKCAPWNYEGKVVLMGDAAHAVVPFYGQGMNAAFEDCQVLNDCLEGFTGDWKSVFEDFSNKRVANGHAIAEMAIENYVEMRDSVGNTRWLFRKKVEHLLEHEFPGKYISRYEMISFTRIPYAESQIRGRLNDEILDALVTGIDAVEDVNLTLAQKLIEEKLSKYYSA